MPDKISPETLKFVRRHFTSLWALELIFVMRLEKDRAWRVSELTQELRASDHVVAGILPGFVDKGLVVEIPGNLFRYRPVMPEMEALMARVADAYATNRVALLDEIFRAPDNSAQYFADAFKLKKKDQ